MRGLVLVLLLVLSFPAAAWASAPAVSVSPSPPSEKWPVKDLIYGVEVIDDYRRAAGFGVLVSPRSTSATHKRRIWLYWGKRSLFNHRRHS